jgi:hypothetical protein
LKHFPSSQERQTLATRSAKEAPHKMHFVVVILRHLQPSLFFIAFVQGEPPFAPATWQTQGSAPTIRHSLLAIRHSPPFSPVAAVLAIRYSLFATHYPCDFFPPLRIQPNQPPTGLMG